MEANMIEDDYEYEYRRNRRWKIVTLTLLLLAVAWLVFSRVKVGDLKGDLNEAKLKNEALLSEKLEVQKSLDTKGIEYDNLLGQNKELDELLEQRNRRITTQNRESQRIKQQLRLAEEENAKGLKMNEELLAKLQAENSKYSEYQNVMNDSVNSLVAQNDYLNNELQKAIRQSINQISVRAEKKNNKLTAKAKKADEIITQLELPSSLNNLSFVIEGPDGTIYEDQNLISSRVLPDTENSAVASNNEDLFIPERQKVEVRFNPEDDLKEGTYTIRLMNNSKYVGEVEMDLRDSFWFF